MGNYNLLKSQIVNDIRTNTNEEITGDLLQERLLDMVESLGAGYQYMGVATPTNPGTSQSPDYNCFYIASTPGTYSYLGGLTVADGEVAILKYNGSWTKEVTGAATAAQVTQLGQELSKETQVSITRTYTDLFFSVSQTTIAAGTAGYKVYYIPVSGAGKYRIVANARATQYIFNVGFATTTPSADVVVSSVEEWGAQNGVDRVYEVAGAGYICICLYYEYVPGTNISAYLLSSRLDEIEGDISTLNTATTKLTNEVGKYALRELLDSGKVVLENGNVNTSGGNSDDLNRIRTASAISTAEIGTIEPPAGYYIARVCYYSVWNSASSFTLAQQTTRSTGDSHAYTIETTYPKVRFTFARTDFADFNIDEFLAYYSPLRPDIDALGARVTTIEQTLADATDPLFVKTISGTPSAAELTMLSVIKDIRVYGTHIDKSKNYAIREISRARNGGYELVLCEVSSAGAITDVFTIKTPTASVTEGTSGITNMVYNQSSGRQVVDITIDYSQITSGGIINLYGQTLHWTIAPSRVFCYDSVPTPGSEKLMFSKDIAAAITASQKPFYVSDIDKYDTNTDFSGQKLFSPSTQRIEHKYEGQVTPEKRYMCVGFDDFRDTDFDTMMPLFEKYGFKATFNRIASAASLDSTARQKISNLVMGRHELGDHTWKHYQFPFTEPLFNGQDPASPEGGQTPFPSNSQMRDDRGDGKNVFGLDLTTPVSTTISYQGPGINTAWGSLSDAECQTIREWFSVMFDTDSDVISVLDELSNQFLGTTGNSRGSWNNVTQQYDGGIFTGCKTSANHEIWERIIIVTQMFYKVTAGVNYTIKTWSLPGSKESHCWFENAGKHYYDSQFTQYVNYLAKFSSSTLKNPDGTAKVRSWADCLREFGYNATHDTAWPGRFDGTGGSSYEVARQFILNAKGRRNDAIPYSSNVTKNFNYDTIRTAYPETDMTGTTSLAAQMYDSANSSAFKNFIEAARRNMSRGIIDVETSDSYNTYSFRLFYEGLLKYCKVTGVELVTKQEAFDICFNHEIRNGNLIYNPRLRNTAKEFMPDATTIPDNPDGYEGTCSVSSDSNNTPILVTSGTTQYDHFGIPEGSLVYKAKVKGTGTIKLQTIKNNNSRYLTSDRVVLATENVANADFADVEIPFSIYEPAAAAYEQVFEGLGDKVIGLGIEYSAGLQIKDIELKLV